MFRAFVLALAVVLSTAIEMIIYTEWLSGDYNFLLYNLMFQEALIKAA